MQAGCAAQRATSKVKVFFVCETYESVKDNWNSLPARADLHVFERWVELLWL
jgi:hypothetical protein